MSWQPTPPLENTDHERAARIVFEQRKHQNCWYLTQQAFIDFFSGCTSGGFDADKFCGRTDTLMSEYNT